MSWISYSNSANSSSVPILAGGLIDTVNGSPTLTAYTMTTTGTVVSGGSGGAGFSVASPPITDGTNVYVTYRDSFPRYYVAYWAISGLGFTTTNNAIEYWTNGFVKCSGSLAIATGGDHSPAYPSVMSYTLPATFVNYANFPSYSGQLGFAVYDGTSVWAVNINTANLFKINPSTLAATVYTLPSIVGVATQQIGCDGSNLYISDGTTIIVWSIGGLSATTHGSVGTSQCYYSANLGVVVIAENVTGGANLYTMPAGGGALTLIGNANTITSQSTDVYATGFCDGPNGNDVWASVATTGGSGSCWNLVYTPGTAFQIIMVP